MNLLMVITFMVTGFKVTGLVNCFFMESELQVTSKWLADKHVVETLQRKATPMQCALKCLARNYQDGTVCAFDDKSGACLSANMQDGVDVDTGLDGNGKQVMLMAKPCDGCSRTGNKQKTYTRPTNAPATTSDPVKTASPTTKKRVSAQPTTLLPTANPTTGEIITQMVTTQENLPSGKMALCGNKAGINEDPNCCRKWRCHTNNSNYPELRCPEGSYYKHDQNTPECVKIGLCGNRPKLNC